VHFSDGTFARNAEFLQLLKKHFRKRGK